MFSETMKKQIEKSFNERFANMPKPDGFQITYSDARSDDERICLKYTYAFMSVSDMASYDPEVFGKIVRQSLEVRELNLWNEDIPEPIWFNFVLQYRINNENIEFNRRYFFDELIDRVKGKTADAAVIETNYWCLEKLTYTGSSMRTLAPFALIRSTQGRCGEESVFTVSALRAIGIPARQIYTPRWAHSDSNHAWVEVFSGGEWKFLGACEPEPVLNKGWFPYPASRGLLIHSWVFSSVFTGEEITNCTKTTQEINRTSFYAENPVSLKIKVMNGNKDVKVHLQLVNGCNLSSFLTLTPDSEGQTSATVGRGDIYLHITDRVKFVTRRIDARIESDVTIDFREAAENETGSVSMVFVPPSSDYKDPDYGLTEEDLSVHKAKEARCHKIRRAFAETFADEAKAGELVRKYGLENLNAEELFINAKGNLTALIALFEPGADTDTDTDTAIPSEYKVKLLKSLPSKDLLDCETDILADHLRHAYPYRDNFNEEIFERYVLSPRISGEMLSAYRSVIAKFFDEEQKNKFRKNPCEIWRYIEENIEDETKYGEESDITRLLTASPERLLKFKIGSEHSRQILFTAICRTVGVPARISRDGSGAEFYENDRFTKVTALKPSVTHKLTINGTGLKFFENFSIARLESGLYTPVRLGSPGAGELRIPGERRNMEGIYDVEEGHYRLLTGVRLPDGSMSVNLYYTNVAGNTSVNVVIPKASGEIEIKNVAECFENEPSVNEKLTGRDIIAYIDPSNEPTEHLLKELLSFKETIKSKKLNVILFSLSSNGTLKSVENELESVTVIYDINFAKKLADKLNFDAENLPVTAIVNSAKEAIYYTQGYQVGTLKTAFANIEWS